MVMQTKNNNYKHLNQEERIEIYTLLSQWKSLRKIWTILQRSHSSISREIKRNSIDYWRWVHKYKPIQAEKFRINKRKMANKKHIILLFNHSLRNKILSILRDKSKSRWPDEIVWRLKLEWFKSISTSTFYRSIYLYYPSWKKYLRHPCWYRKRYSKSNQWQHMLDIPLITHRPIYVNSRLHIGHREWDTIVWKDHKSWLLNITERKSRFILIHKINSFHSHSVKDLIIYLLYNHKIKSLTTDNWIEFSKLSAVRDKLWIDCYRAHPYSCFERWTNERANWLIRQFIPKSSDINSYSNSDISNIQNLINHKPRKILHYRTPYEVYFNTILAYLN